MENCGDCKYIRKEIKHYPSMDGEITICTKYNKQLYYIFCDDTGCKKCKECEEDTDKFTGIIKDRLKKLKDPVIIHIDRAYVNGGEPKSEYNVKRFIIDELEKYEEEQASLPFGTNTIPIRLAIDIVNRA